MKLSLNYAKEFGNEGRLAGVSYWSGRFAYMQGDFFETLHQSKRCIQWAKDLNDPELLAASYNLFGRSCLYTDEYSKGIRYVLKYLKGSTILYPLFGLPYLRGPPVFTQEVRMKGSD